MLKVIKQDEAQTKNVDDLKAAIPDAFWPRAVGDGKLRGVRMGQRQIAHGLHDAGFRDLDLLRGVMVCGSESWLFTKASNDNLAAVGSLPVGRQVRSMKKLELLTVSGKSNGLIDVVDLAGDGRQLTPDTNVITSRDIGLMEINISPAAMTTEAEKRLYVPAVNFAAAYDLYQRRGFEPWVGFTSGTYLHDTYLQWALLGVANFYDEVLLEAAKATGYKSQTKLPWIGLAQVRKLYPEVNLG